MSLPSIVLKPQSELKIPENWKIEKDVPLDSGKELTLSLSEFLQKEETAIKGKEMLKRANKLGNLAGLAHARYLFSRKEMIPEEWKKYILIFAGTELRVSRGVLDVPCLLWYGGEWYLTFHWIGHDFFSLFRLVRLS